MDEAMINDTVSQGLKAWFRGDERKEEKGSGVDLPISSWECTFS
jgi:hypothetical protein